MATLNAMYDIGLVIVFYHPDPETTINVARACAAGGARLIEFTNRGDCAFEVFAQLEKYCRTSLPEMITGVGSIVDPETAGLYINHGASFVVGPLLNPAVAALCNRRKVAYSPGCGSVTEIAQAEELGCEIVKVFPGEQVGGPAFVKGVLGPCPWVSMMPTGGVEPTEESLTTWFNAGIVCAGIGSKLVSDELIKKKDFDGITSRVKETVGIISRLKAQRGKTHHG